MDYPHIDGETDRIQKAQLARGADLRAEISFSGQRA
jgi:hypothetical protein